MFAKVRVSKGALNYFRKLARNAAPLEIEAYLAGKVISLDEVEITRFYYTKNYLTQTSNQVQWGIKEIEALKERAESKGLRIIGSIHSHPNWDAVMSPDDYKAYVTEQLILCGICSVYDRKTRVRFWTPTCALPCKVIYK